MWQNRPQLSLSFFQNKLISVWWHRLKAKLQLLHIPVGTVSAWLVMNLLICTNGLPYTIYYHVYQCPIYQSVWPYKIIHQIQYTSIIIHNNSPYTTNSHVRHSSSPKYWRVLSTLSGEKEISHFWFSILCCTISYFHVFSLLTSVRRQCVFVMFCFRKYKK
jgi:hypothetical protein